MVVDMDPVILTKRQIGKKAKRQKDNNKKTKNTKIQNGKKAKRQKGKKQKEKEKKSKNTGAGGPKGPHTIRTSYNLFNSLGARELRTEWEQLQ